MNRDFRFLVYRSANEDVSVNAIIKDETVWLTQKGMAALFGVNIPAVSKHLHNIYEEGELRRDTTVSRMEIVQTEGERTVRRNVDLYNLDAIISVGYRVSSARATHFRIWATGVLKEFMIKGFALDDERLKQENSLWKRLFQRVAGTGSVHPGQRAQDLAADHRYIRRVQHRLQQEFPCDAGLLRHGAE